jgi:nucleosome binding factor SPN SPT16 subunit
MSIIFTAANGQTQEKYYSILLEARNEAFKLMKPDVTAKDVYEGVAAFIRGRSGTLADSFAKTIGFAVSLYPSLSMRADL